MSFTNIQRAMATGVLPPESCHLAVPPSELEVGMLRMEFGERLFDDHAQLILEWGGSTLAGVRIAAAEEVRLVGEHMVFAFDRSGTIYLYDRGGTVYCEAPDGVRRPLACSIRGFVEMVVLGHTAEGSA